MAYMLPCHVTCVSADEIFLHSVDMRLFRCLPYLNRIRTQSLKPDSMLDRQRPLVAGARLWLAVSQFRLH